jgi:GTPase SAR1 family protein
MDETSLIKKKICLLGSFAVGKTSLVERFVYNRFDEKYLTTIGVKVSQKILPPVRNPKGGKLIQFNFLIWDIERVEKFDTVVMNYYRGAAGALAVADMTRPETISGLQRIADKFYSVSPTAQLLILGNKLDIFQQDNKTLTLLSNTASNFSTEYLLTSAKTGELVEEAFLKLAERIGMPSDA